MNDEHFNMAIRKYLKELGVTAQRAIEEAVRKGTESGKLRGNEKLAVKTVLSIDAIGLEHHVEGVIALD